MQLTARFAVLCFVFALFAFGGTAEVVLGEEETAASPATGEQGKICLLKEKLVPELRRIMEMYVVGVDRLSGTTLTSDEREKFIQDAVVSTLSELAHDYHIAENAADCPSGAWHKKFQP